MMDGMLVPNSSNCLLKIKCLAVKPEVCATWAFVPLVAVTDKASLAPPGLFRDGKHVTSYKRCSSPINSLIDRFPRMKERSPAFTSNVHSNTLSRSTGPSPELKRSVPKRTQPIDWCTKKAPLAGADGRWTQGFAQLNPVGAHFPSMKPWGFVSGPWPGSPHLWEENLGRLLMRLQKLPPGNEEWVGWAEETGGQTAWRVMTKRTSVERSLKTQVSCLVRMVNWRQVKMLKLKDKQQRREQNRKEVSSLR